MSERGIVIKFLAGFSTAALLGFSANFLRRHKEGVNVDDSLNALCEELAKRYGVDLCKINIHHSDGNFLGDWDGPLLYAALLCVGALVFFGRRRSV